jgi:hypothetical protein
MGMTLRVAVSVAAVTLTVAMSDTVLGAAPDSHRRESGARPTRLQSTAVDGAKLTVRVTPLVLVTRGDARGVVWVPRHADNRVLRVVLESEEYSSRSEVELDGEDAPQSHSFYWRDLPPGFYRVTVDVYGTNGLRASTSTGTTESISKER